MRTERRENIPMAQETLSTSLGPLFHSISLLPLLSFPAALAIVPVICLCHLVDVLGNSYT